MSDPVQITLIICGTILAIVFGVAGIFAWVDRYSYLQWQELQTRVRKVERGYETLGVSLEKLTQSSTYGKGGNK